MEPHELHPIDDTPEPGCYSTLGYLREQVENYAEKRDKVRLAETQLKAAQRTLEAAKVEFHYAVSGLTRAIEQANKKQTAALNERMTEAPSIDVTSMPEGTRLPLEPLEGTNPCIESDDDMPF